MNPSKTPLYIGVTDFTNANQAGMMLDLVPSEHRYSLMVGTMMSYKVLNGINSKWATAPSWCKPGDLSRPFVAHPKAFNTLHWADYDGVTGLGDLNTAVMLSGPNLHALQLDMIWPSHRLVKYFAERHDIPVVLQVGRAAVALAQDLDGIARYLESYGDSISYALLDMSGGEGKPLDPEATLSRLRFLAPRFPQLRFAVAGGLGPDTLDLLVPIMTEFPDISIDAQGKLRLSGNAMHPLERFLVERYIERAFALLR